MEPSHKIFERWQDLSDKAAKLLVWLVVNAPCSGMIAANREGIARAHGWTVKVLRGAIKELETKSCITVERATSRHTLTRIQITHSLLDDSGNATPSQMGRGNTEAKVTPSQTGSSEISTTSQTDTSSVPDVPSEPNLADKPLELPGKYLAGELSVSARQTLEYIGFACDQKYISRGFVSVLDWLGKRAHLPLPGLLASRIIDRCLFQQRKRAAEKKNPALYFWPPRLQRHRDALRKKERPGW